MIKGTKERPPKGQNSPKITPTLKKELDTIWQRLKQMLGEQLSARGSLKKVL